MGKEKPVVKWLYPGAETIEHADDDENTGDEERTENSTITDSVDNQNSTGNTKLAADGNPEDKPDERTEKEERYGDPVLGLADDLTRTVSSAVGSWFPADPKLPRLMLPTAGEMSSRAASGMTSLLTAVKQVSGLESKSSGGGGEDTAEENATKPSEQLPGLDYLTRAFSKLGSQMDPFHGLNKEPEDGGDANDQNERDTSDPDLLAVAYSQVGKTAKLLQANMSIPAMLRDFKATHQSFLMANRGRTAAATAPPWAGYDQFDELKAKLLQLSSYPRTFINPPPGSNHHDDEFDLADNSRLADEALFMLKTDPQLEAMRYKLVPKQVSENAFWRNYFYRVNITKEMFKRTPDESVEVASGPADDVSLEESAETTTDESPPVQPSTKDDGGGEMAVKTEELC